MSVTATSMKCPVCPGQTLETFSTAIGDFERCPHCLGLFVRQEVIASASRDRAQSLEAFGETKALLLPTDKWCPRCLQKLFDGRVRSRSIIFTLCPNCQAVWSDLTKLRQFEETVEKNLRVQIDLATSNGSSPAAAPPVQFKSSQDTAVGGIFRTVARLFDQVADQFSGGSPKPAKAQKPAPKVVKEAKPAKVLPPAPKPEPAPKAEAAPKIEIPEFVFPKETHPAPVPEPKPEPTPAPPPTPVPAPIPAPTPAPAPATVVAAKPIPVPQPLPAGRQEPPVKKKPEGSSFFEKLKKAWAPTPKKPIAKPVQPAKPVEPIKPVELVKPVESVKPVEPVKPIELAKPAQPTKPAKPIKPAGDGFIKKTLIAFKAALKPQPRKPKPVTPAKPIEPMRPVELVNPVEPVKLAKPTEPAKPVKLPKPKKERPPRAPLDHVAFWPPWALGLLGFIASSFRDFGFEAGPALLWAVAGGSAGLMIRLARMYPFKPFEESTLQALSEIKDPLGWRGIPVTLKGDVVPVNDLEPKGEVHFKQEARTLALNRLGRWDIIPRLFGLSNPRQILKGSVVLKGWYRRGLVPYLEIQEVKSEKTVRKSMVRALRWVFAVTLFLLAMIVYLSLD